ncbi:hypothetical protein SELSPUOL_01937 [Selenomonas sputigena ATCC 35185]|uniref:Uncharacterized protein n=1 Tax=Selenomonas sputigena (strain ATCC 35185 / DSM 20758 / CCUG 44933 / VPI D19B-28) TaxID=546271 RepID=C9LWT2_SELS3|nr:hypothetical protein SELSPUOL_01937 [Selenomonas sputigena ATCC 35185]
MPSCCVPSCFDETVAGNRRKSNSCRLARRLNICSESSLEKFTS